MNGGGDLTAATDSSMMEQWGIPAHLMKPIVPRLEPNFPR
jgi:hypothetical protein